MLTTRFRVWLQHPRIAPVWTGVKLVDLPEHVEAGCVEVTVEGDGQELRQLIAKRRVIFAAYLQMKPEGRERSDRRQGVFSGPSAVLEPSPRPHRQQD